MRQLALRIARIAKDKKGIKTIVLDLRQVSSWCDYFVITSANSLRQMAAIAQTVEEELAKDGISPRTSHTWQKESGWVVLDFGAVVAHIFYKPLRDYYALERLWSDAKKVRITSATYDEKKDRRPALGRVKVSTERT